MRIVYVLLSPTPGMHQYTGDLAAQMIGAGHEVHVVTTTEAQAQRDRYPHEAVLHMPVRQRSTGFALDGLHGQGLWCAHRCIVGLRPDLVHFSGVHLWNPLLMMALKAGGLAVVHTLHDLDPHPDVAHGSLIRLWNRTVITTANGVVVHGECYRDRLVAGGRPPSTVLATPLLHSFLPAVDHEQLEARMPEATFAPWALFFGRFERYKGVEVLLQAQHRLAQQPPNLGLMLAGGGDLGAIWPQALPPGAELLNRRIEGHEGHRLFQGCGLVVLPYTGATQSAIPATAYAFGKPVIVSTSGALPEVVQPGVTGWVTPAGDAAALADCLATALENPERLAEMGVAGRRWYEERRCRQPLELGRFYAAIVSRKKGGEPTQ